MTTDESTDEPQFGHYEGWFSDPWGRHEARWISDGTATDLVRDGDIERRDAPPTTAPMATPSLIQAESADHVGADDLKRADEAQAVDVDPESLRRRLDDAAEEGIGGSWG